MDKWTDIILGLIAGSMVALIARSIVLQLVYGRRLYNAHYQRQLTMLQFFFRQSAMQSEMKALLKSPTGTLPAQEERWRHSIVSAAATAKRGFFTFVAVFLLLAAGMALVVWLRE